MTTAIALFNNKGSVGKTTLTYHLANMVARLGWRVLAVDLDPQANLTSAFFDEDKLELFWEPESNGTILSSVAPGDLGLSSFEDRLSDAWPRSFLGDEGAIRVTTAFHRIIRGSAVQMKADVIFLDVGPNLGAINRAALLASDALVVPLAADLFSLQGLRSLGPTLREWRRAWQDIVLPRVPAAVHAPAGTMEPIGYVVLQRAVRLDRPVKAYDRWLRRIPGEFHRSVLGEGEPSNLGGGADPCQLASLRNYRSLMPLAQDARKPMFDLRARDGALGSTGRLVQTCYREFEDLAVRVMEAANIPMPVPS